MPRGISPLPIPAVLKLEFATWLRDERGYARTTRTTRLQHADQADRFMQRTFGRRLIRTQPEHLKAWLATKELPASRNSALSSLKCYFTFAREKGYRKTDPAADLRRLKGPRYLPRPLAREEVSRLRAAAVYLSFRHRVIVDLALFAGPRRAEIASLRWTDVDLEGQRVRFFGKGSKEGVVPLHPALMPLLGVWRVLTWPSEWVFPSRVNDGHLKPGRIWQAVHEAAQSAGLKGITPHRLRHTFATELLEAGSDVRHVQELLRHASLQSTQIYTAVSVGRLEEDIARLDFGEEGTHAGPDAGG